MTALMELDQDFMQFTRQLNSHTGIDLSMYKENQMKRRLNNLKENKGFGSFAELFKAMMKNKELYDQFLDHMTINVSEFYRNASRWDVLKKKIIPELLKTNQSIRCWSAACSTGDEPYSLVMLLSSLLDWRNIHVLATDIDQGAIAKAKCGVYGAASLREVPKPVLNKYFTVDGNTYKVADEVKQRVTFKQQNLLSDRFESNFDLIVCRNVLIYFTEEAKDSLFHKFSASLKKGGYFFIGGTEQIFEPQKYGLQPLDTFFYRKI